MTAFSTAFGFQQQRVAGKKLDKADKVRAKAASIQNAKSRRQRIAQAQQARAATVAQANATSVGGGSSASQAAGSQITQGAADVSFAKQLEGFDQTRFDLERQSNKALSRSNTAFAISDTLKAFAPNP